MCKHAHLVENVVQQVLAAGLSLLPGVYKEGYDRVPHAAQLKAVPLNAVYLEKQNLAPSTMSMKPAPGLKGSDAGTPLFTRAQAAVGTPACVSWSAMEKSMKAFSQLNLRGADNMRGSLYTGTLCSPVTTSPAYSNTDRQAQGSGIYRREGCPIFDTHSRQQHEREKPDQHKT
ncbi:MAG: hypothetical protein FRX49_03486 [Trebouxia sp. A1-2]|nr:MAG: hypothetical protein FRX49_03486 [Trebouxia sp. A1-2]